MGRYDIEGMNDFKVMKESDTALALKQIKSVEHTLIEQAEVK